MSIEKQQDMEVLGMDLSPSVSIKDRTVVDASDKIQLWPGPVLLCAPCGGRSD